MVQSGELDSLIGSYVHLKQYARQEEALHTLKRIASMVKPLMRARGWRVGELSEFFPSQANLLGLNENRGQRIFLRLRYPGDMTQFLPFEQVTDTMLHELAHNVWGPHDQKFHALWDQLREELEGLIMKGYTGDGFLSKGYRLGGHHIPYQEIRRATRAEAERRKPPQASQGRRLGGSAPRPGGDIRTVITQSVQRRNSIVSDQGCGNLNRNENEIREISEQWRRNGFRTKAEEDAANEAAIAQALWELVQEDEQRKYGDTYIPPSAQNPYGNGGGAYLGGQRGERGNNHGGNIQEYYPPSYQQPPPVPYSTRPPPPPPQVVSRPKSPDYWACSACTLHNPLHVGICGVCEAPRSANGQSSNKPPSYSTSGFARGEVIDLTHSPEKKNTTTPSTTTNRRPAGSSLLSQQRNTRPPPPPPAPPKTWMCSFCGNVMEHQWWTCFACGRVKDKS
ncbi:WLM domain-containing protein [Podospora australis]|uniref:WLM domain-containing protein n=1 Tax=Podospora australis TaxID=1536484 RepID=A0AAN6X3S3_9PEZI|nr:WLM domain-containing protein [Podospora australis]